MTSIENPDVMSMQTPGLDEHASGACPDDLTYLTYVSTRAVVDYCAEAGISDIVYLDRSARGIYVGVSEYQRLVRPDGPHLGAYFLNPDTVKLQDGVDTERHLREVEAQLEQSRSALLSRRNAPMLLFDVCAHSGDTLGNTHRTLELLGFSAIKLGVLTDNTATRNSDLQLDFSFTTHQQPMDCQAFGRDDRLVKGPGHVFVHVGRQADNTPIIAQRRSIRDQVRAGYNALHHQS